MVPRNVEIKARARDWEGQLQAVHSCAAAAGDLLQEDAFFACPNGRLKLRTVEDGDGPDPHAALILYRRPDRAGPKASDYFIAPVADPATLQLLLSEAYGQTAVVRKRRQLFLADTTRIHFDEVEGLGCFIELEVVLQPGQTESEGEAIACALMRVLGIQPADLVAGAYADQHRGASAPGAGLPGSPAGGGPSFST